jgi:hypothetical protein
MDRYKGVLLILLLLVFVKPVAAQNNLVATLETLNPTVEVLRADTSNWIAVEAEALVSANDRIRTGSEGRARVTFFADGVDTEILPNTEYVINEFQGNGMASYELSVTVLAGETIQRLERLLDSSSTYDVTTPNVALVARGTIFRVRVESSRSLLLVDEGEVEASNQENSSSVAGGFGLRAEPGIGLSEVVAASTYAQLDSGIDGCESVITITEDVSLNVRIGADMRFPRIGSIQPFEITRLMGFTEDQSWFRIQFRDHFGWVRLEADRVIDVDPACAGLREFPVGYGPEDPTRFTSFGDVIEREVIETELETLLETTPEATPAM